MKKLRFKLIVVIIVTITIITMSANFVHANVESKPNTASLTRKSVSAFFTLIRQMESTTGPLGLEATFDSDGNETSQSNNIDAHMIKNTEYGAAGMLASSIYGEKNLNGTTTGNATGIYQMGTGKNGDKSEYVAGILGTSNSGNIAKLKNAPQKYWDNYSEEAVFKAGDGTLEISWSNSDSSDWVSSRYPVFERYYLYGPLELFQAFLGDDSSISSRAVIVTGNGF